LKFYITKKSNFVQLHYVADMRLAVVNWHGNAVQYLFLAFICTTFFGVSL